MKENNEQNSRDQIMLSIETRGLIDKAITDAFLEQNMINTINWLLENKPNNIKIYEPLAIGYFFGSLLQGLTDLVGNAKIMNAYEMVKNDPIRMSEINTEVTSEEQEEIKDILKRWIPQFKEKIRKEIALLQTH